MTITPEKLAKLRKAIAALRAEDIEHDCRCPWTTYESSPEYVYSMTGCAVASAGVPVAAYIAAADPQTVLALVEEVERLRDERDSWIESVWNCLKAAGAPDDLDEAERTVSLAGEKPSHFVKQAFDRLSDSNAKVTDARDNLLDEVERLRAKNAALRERLYHPCEGCPGCSSGDCPDALSITRTELAKYKWAVHVECTDAGYTYDSALAEALRERDELQRKLDNNQIDLLVCDADCRDLQAFVEEQRAGIERLQARVAELEAAMAQRMGVYAAPNDERQVGS